MKVESSDNADLATAIDAWYAMKQSAAFDEFTRRWNDEDERDRLWKEIVNYWGVDGVFPGAPKGLPAVS